MNANLTLIMGGARSGKSTYAENFAKDSGKHVLFIATATAGDAEMADRIAKHQASRPSHWDTLEVPEKIDLAVQDYLQQRERSGKLLPEIVLFDCLTMLSSNVLCRFEEPLDFAGYETALAEEMEGLIAAMNILPAQWLVISNEVGLGIVPSNAYSRAYRDGLGRANQRLAKAAGEVLFMVAGLPMKVK
jgi:adenosylcobinamide kinase/adenosylcobinamide-phosphate guanylyltransferase